MSRCRPLDQAADWLSFAFLPCGRRRFLVCRRELKRNPAGASRSTMCWCGRGEYAIDYGQALTSVLADEHYTRRLVWRRGGD